MFGAGAGNRASDLRQLRLARAAYGAGGAVVFNPGRGPQRDSRQGPRRPAFAIPSKEDAKT